MPSTAASSTSRIRSIARRAAVGTVAVGALSLGVFGLTGTAGAATTAVPRWACTSTATGPTRS